jgi:hypothetical protein
MNTTYRTARHPLNWFTKEDISMVRIETSEEVKARLLEQANRYIKIAEKIEDLNLGPLPDVLITYEFCGNNSGSGEVMVELWDTGDEEEKYYDMGFSTDNRDNWGMHQTVSAINVVLERHFELGLHKMFRMIGED